MSLKEKVVYGEKRYCETCDSWTETPATYCKQCGSKLTYSPQKCSTDLVRLEDAQKEIDELKQKLQQVQYILNREYPRNWGLDAVDSDKLRRIRDLLEEEKEKEAK